jgi:RND superfamily putative drug exporter
VSLGFLVATFRSIVLPLKAIAMNLLATGAALGATVAVFQWGWGERLFGFPSAGSGEYRCAVRFGTIRHRLSGT